MDDGWITLAKLDHRSSEKALSQADMQLNDTESTESYHSARQRNESAIGKVYSI